MLLSCCSDYCLPVVWSCSFALSVVNVRIGQITNVAASEPRETRTARMMQQLKELLFPRSLMKLSNPHRLRMPLFQSTNDSYLLNMFLLCVILADWQAESGRLTQSTDERELTLPVRVSTPSQTNSTTTTRLVRFFSSWLLSPLVL